MIKRELLLFLFLFLFLSVSVHFHAWITDPLGQIENLPGSALGPLHPLWITFGIYLLVLVVRVVLYAVKK